MHKLLLVLTNAGVNKRDCDVSVDDWGYQYFNIHYSLMGLFS